MRFCGPISFVFLTRSDGMSGLKTLVQVSSTLVLLSLGGFLERRSISVLFRCHSKVVVHSSHEYQYPRLSVLELSSVYHSLDCVEKVESCAQHERGVGRLFRAHANSNKFKSSLFAPSSHHPETT